mmetsp:Transcript_29761/g.70046  ORF Transcript_29761/g.70046 Transcript_29761/m.70046 type:complete len:245 (+) Transcript_29761:1870-2604(+)
MAGSALGIVQRGCCRSQRQRRRHRTTHHPKGPGPDHAHCLPPAEFPVPPPAPAAGIGLSPALGLRTDRPRRALQSQGAASAVRKTHRGGPAGQQHHLFVGWKEQQQQQQQPKWRQPGLRGRHPGKHIQPRRSRRILGRHSISVVESPRNLRFQSSLRRRQQQIRTDAIQYATADGCPAPARSHPAGHGRGIQCVLPIPARWFGHPQAPQWGGPIEGTPQDGDLFGRRNGRRLRRRIDRGARRQR